MARILRQQSITSPPTRRAEFAHFKGIDLSSSVVTVKPYRSPDAQNMMPDLDGFPVKRPGYKLEKELEGCIYGAHIFETDALKKELIHAGRNLYDDDEMQTILWSEMNEQSSCSFQMQGKLLIVDGKRLLVYDGERVTPADEMATTPLITVARNPSGDGAESFKPVNLLTQRVTDSFLGEEGVLNYKVSFHNFSIDNVEVKVVNNEGSWVPKTDFTADPMNSQIKFTTAPGASPVAGEDNVRITYDRPVESDEGEPPKDKINKCTIGILYGVNGALDRLWLSGNPKYPAYDWYSEFQDPTFFGDLWYAVVGQNASKIVGYATLSDRLVTFKQNEENNRNVFVRDSYLDDDDKAQFPFTNVLQGDSALGAVGSLNNEPLFLTRQGVFALTQADVTGERYSQNRSYYLQGGLMKEPHLENAKAVSFGRYFALAINNKLYLLDKEQKTYEANQPHSSFQYEGYLWTNIPATALWERNGSLCFGTEKGEVMCFFEAGAVGGYNDNVRLNPASISQNTQGNLPGDETDVVLFSAAENGQQEKEAQEPEWIGDAIDAYWTTPLMELSGWSRYKTITDVWLVGQPYNRSGGEIYYATDKEYAAVVKDYNIDTFNFNDIDFERFTFNTLNTPMVIPTRKKAKKVKLFQVKVRNNRQGEPFGIIAITLEYRENGKIKK